MGIHVCVHRRVADRYDEVPVAEWDYLRHTGDREFVAEVLTYEFTTEVNYPNDWQGPRYRPKDWAAWWNWAESQVVNRERFVRLVKLLEEDPDLYVFVSW